MSYPCWKRETIGNPDCPIFYRWILVKLPKDKGKMMVHHFLPNVDDRDMHDHPWPFLTIVLKGSYDNMIPAVDDPFKPVFGERVRAGSVRYRPATHVHRTRTGPNGCWTVVFTGPLIRHWGFWRDGRWWDWRSYNHVFGKANHCGDDEH